MDRWANIIVDSKNTELISIKDLSLRILCLNSNSMFLNFKHNWGAEDVWVVFDFVLFFPSLSSVWDLWDVYILVPQTSKSETWTIKIDHCAICERGQLWSTENARMNSSSKVKPDIPTETKHGLTHVVQMRHLKHFGYSALSLTISYSYLLQDIQYILAGWG